MNRFQVDEPPPSDLLRVDTRVQQEQIESLRALRGRRDGRAVAEALAELKRGAEGEVNLMPLILDAVRAYATVGEVCDVLRGVFGEYRERIVI
ncbi:hypothetical protein EG835_07160 [bacterium]|nr:hypothetical protein [bacterium]